MNRKKATVAGLPAGSVGIGALALAMPAMPAMPAISGSGLSMDITGGSAAGQTIHLPNLATPPTYGQTIDFSSSGGASGNPVTVTAGPPEVCTAGETAGQMVLGGVGRCSFTLNQAGDADYEAAGSVQAGFTVRPAPLTIKMDDKTKAFNSPDPVWTFTYDGLVNGDTEADLDGLKYTVPVSDWSPGRWIAHPWGATSPSYDITFVNATLTINPRLSIKVLGLPSDVPNKVVLDKTFVDLPVAEREVDYGSTHSIQFIPTFSGGDGSVWVTTRKDVTVTATADLGFQANYHTVPQLIENIFGGSYPIVAYHLKWKYNNLTSLDDRRELADRIWAQAGLTTSWGEANIIVKYLQVVYEREGGTGTV